MSTAKNKEEMVPMHFFLMPKALRGDQMTHCEALPMKNPRRECAYPSVRIPSVDGYKADWATTKKEFSKKNCPGNIGKGRIFSPIGLHLYELPDYKLRHINMPSFQIGAKSILDKTQQITQYLEDVKCGRYEGWTKQQIADHLGLRDTSVLNGMIKDINWVNQDNIEELCKEVMLKETHEFISDMASAREFFRTLLDDLKRERSESPTAAERQLLKQSGGLVSQTLNSITNASESLRKMLGIDRPSKQYLKATEDLHLLMNKSIEAVLLAFIEVKDCSAEEVQQIFERTVQKQRELFQEVKSQAKKYGASEEEVETLSGEKIFTKIEVLDR
jgi:hypothetical protein